MKRENEPMLDTVNGDIGMSRHLSKALKILAENPGIDNDLKQQLRDIMNGKGSLRDLAQSESFLRFSDAAMPKIAADMAGKTPEEMRRLAEAGEKILENYRNEVPDTPPSAESHQNTSTIRAQSIPTPTTPPNPAPDVSHGNDPGPARNVIPGTRKPNRDRVVMPDEPDDDDLYYQDRRQRGWLV
ncbi:hypothetical protein [Nocardia australiensis]|uniref:hypothetical protein n=1 Tax=Nocardia australiensis TaxID=2887191 RepID=UPI001D135C96|nr:hypothetical protein [Nocardia australiensis]